MKKMLLALLAAILVLSFFAGRARRPGSTDRAGNARAGQFARSDACSGG